ncbi:MAG: IS1380 family transposase [Rectinemataceae bacterium]|nr:IS1380 family transposase [Rectinemataceae bacterium]
MRPVEFIIKEGNELLTSHSGLALIGALLSRTKLGARVDAATLPGCREPKIPHSDIVKAMIGLLCLGKPDFDAIEHFRGIDFFDQSLGLGQCPASPTLRQRLDVVDGAFDRIIREESAQLIRRTANGIGTVTTGKGELAPLDIDVSPFDNSKTKKEGVSRTYKGSDGFAPIFAYLGREGYQVNVEFREGSQHSQKNTPVFLQETIEYAKMITDTSILVRLDAGNDALDNIAACIKGGTDWLIKRNLRRESLQDWLKIAQETGAKNVPRQGKTVWYGETHRQVDGFEKPLRIVFEVIERTIKKGQYLLVPEIEVNSWWTSLEDGALPAILLYHDHGTSEQFHSEIKSDMDLERLPSESFSTNADIMSFALLAYNLLRLCGQESIREDNGNLANRAPYRKKAGRRRLRTVIQDLMYLASRISCHARRLHLSFGRSSHWAIVWQNLYRGFMVPVT